MSKSYRTQLKKRRFDTGVYKWCYEKFGKPFTNWHVVRYANCDIYSFKHEEDYVLFLLTWGND